MFEVWHMRVDMPNRLFGLRRVDHRYKEYRYINPQRPSWRVHSLEERMPEVRCRVPERCSQETFRIDRSATRECLRTGP